MLDGSGQKMDVSEDPKQPACNVRTRLDLQSLNSSGTMTGFVGGLFNATLSISSTHFRSLQCQSLRGIY